MLGRNRSLLRLLALLMTFALVAAACGGDNDTASEETNTEPSDDSASSDNDNTSDDNTSDDNTSDDNTSDDTSASDEAASDGADADDSVGVVEIEEDPVETGPVAGGTLRFGVQAETDGLNPTSSAFAPAGYTMANAVFDTLAAYDVDGNTVPFLAESFTPNDDFTSWTIKLREGISFHDGTPLNADAAMLSYDTTRNDFLVGIAVRPFVQAENGVEKVDDMTFRINLVDPWRYWPATVTGQLGMVASSKWLAAAIEDPTLNQEPVGTGPFIFDSRSQDSVTRFVRNDDYWLGEVYLDAIEFNIVTDAEVRTTLFDEEQLDGLHTNDPGSIDFLRSSDGVQNALDDTGEEQMDLINTSAPPFDDIRARRALTLAAPQDNYVALLGLGVTRRADQIFEPNSPYYNPDVVQETDRPDEAAALAAEYCGDFPENCTDNKINFVRQTTGPSINQTREAELLAEGWSVAFNMTSNEVPEDTGIQNAATGAYQVADWRQFGAVDPSVDNVWLLCRTIGGLSLNFVQFCDEERDALLLAAQLEPDPAARAALYQELAAKLNQDYTYIFYTHTLWDIAFAENVHGACGRTGPDGDDLLCQINGRTFYDSLWMSE
jgi:peptide/nickel transport system substrate-binding protein